MSPCYPEMHLKKLTTLLPLHSGPPFCPPAPMHVRTTSAGECYVIAFCIWLASPLA